MYSTYANWTWAELLFNERVYLKLCVENKKNPKLCMNYTMTYLISLILEFI